MLNVTDITAEDFKSRTTHAVDASQLGQSLAGVKRKLRELRADIGVDDDLMARLAASRAEKSARLKRLKAEASELSAQYAAVRQVCPAAPAAQGVPCAAGMSAASPVKISHRMSPGTRYGPPPEMRREEIIDLDGTLLPEFESLIDA